MPELPEVQTVVSELNEKIINKSLYTIMQLRNNTIVGDITDFKAQNVTSVFRRGKYIIITLDYNKIIVHLRMTGKLIYSEELNLSKHTRAYFIFSDESVLFFDDIRAFGKIWLIPRNETIPGIENLGVEPLSKEFDKYYLKKVLKNKKSPIKNLLLKQDLIAGLGNIYVCEILYRAKIHPDVLGQHISEKQMEDIVSQTKLVLELAIQNNGTTISDFRRIDDKTGEFQNFLKVYQKDYCECGEKIMKKKHSGRTTYFCNKCQKI